MIARELVGTAAVPDGDPLRLFRRGDEFTIAMGGNELMSSRMSGSEEALAEMSCDRLHHDAIPHLLIGGYGMGFTLRTALARLGADARITVAELVPAIIDWARGPMTSMTAGCLDDPRVEIQLTDVAQVISTATRRYDAILLDVDNGPGFLIHVQNARVYAAEWLRTASERLTPGGVLVIWSEDAAPELARALAGLGVLTETVIEVDREGRRFGYALYQLRRAAS